MADEPLAPAAVHAADVPNDADAPAWPPRAAPPLLQALGLTKQYRLPREQLWRPPGVVHALQDVDFALQAGRSLGVVGESGSGKSTLARLVMGLEAPTVGEVRFEGKRLHTLPPAELRRLRAGFQMVFQDPFGSLDPRMTVGRIVAEPLAAQGVPGPEQRARVAQMLAQVGLAEADAERLPHAFSGGQRQRIAIARALVTHPRLIVADEPVSALDVSVQAQVLNLMQQLQEDLGIAYLFISHDLAVVDLVCDDLLVLFQGRVVEEGPADLLFTAARHPYTQALIDAAPHLATAARPVRPRNVPDDPMSSAPEADAAAEASTDAAASGCAFRFRCPRAFDRCAIERPLLQSPAAEPLHRVACHLVDLHPTETVR